MHRTKFARHTFLSFLLLLALAGCSQWMDFSPAIPADPAVTVGKLDNGLTYYVRKNAKPAKRAELRLIVNAGSLQEDEDQRGLAHFVEHMAFNGTRDYPRNELVSYLQGIGMEFGADLNASTGFDETQYELSVPIDQPENLDKALGVMENWAAYLSFDPAEIEKERTVVLEEARSGKGAQDRLMQRILPEIFFHSRYAERLPIGDETLLKTFSHDALKRYYRDWYRPDLMAIVAVGDFDQDAVVSLIEKHFSHLKNPDHPRPLVSTSFEKRTNPGAIVQTDPELDVRMLFVVYGHHPKQRTTTESAYRANLIDNLYESMLADRLNELTLRPHPPFLSAGTGSEDFVRNRSMVTSYALIGKPDPQEALLALVQESEKSRRFGFRQEELDKSTRQLLRLYEDSFNEKEKQNSSWYVDDYAFHFLEGEPMPGIETEYAYIQKMLPTISLEELNAHARQHHFKPDQALVIYAGPPDKDPAPVEDQLLTKLQLAYKQPVVPHEMSEIPEHLIERKPTPGKIINSHTDSRIGYEELQLSNGTRVILKPTQFKSDQILLSAYRQGGGNLYPAEDKLNADYASSIVGEMGTGSFSPHELERVLAGKSASVYNFIGRDDEQVSGYSNSQDIETMMQLLYLSFTAPRRDPVLFESYMNRRRQNLENQMNDPSSYFQDQLMKAYYQDNPYAPRILQPADLDKIKLDRVLDIYRERFGDAGGFLFTIIGNFDPATIKPLVETYIGSLPASKQESTYRDVGLRPVAGKQITVYKGIEPKSDIRLYINTDTPYSPKQSLQLRLLADILDIRITDVIREKMGMIYGASFSASMTRLPYPHATASLYVPCGPENVDKVLTAFWQEVESIRRQGPRPEDLAKVKATLIQHRKEALETNSYWLGNIEDTVVYGDDPAFWLEPAQVIDAVTTESIRQTAIRFVDRGRAFQAVLYPENSGQQN